jgi:hypothetical protein
MDAVTDMMKKFSREWWPRRLRKIVKTVVLIPIWLLILPLRRHHVFRYYDYKLDHLANTPFTRAAYVFSIACWLALIVAIAAEVREME